MYSAEKAATLRRHCEARSNPLSSKHSAKKVETKHLLLAGGGTTTKQFAHLIIKLFQFVKQIASYPRNDER